MLRNAKTLPIPSVRHHRVVCSLCDNLSSLSPHIGSSHPRDRAHRCCCLLPAACCLRCLTACCLRSSATAAPPFRCRRLRCPRRRRSVEGPLGYRLARDSYLGYLNTELLSPCWRAAPTLTSTHPLPVTSAAPASLIASHLQPAIAAWRHR